MKALREGPLQGVQIHRRQQVAPTDKAGPDTVTAAIGADSEEQIGSKSASSGMINAGQQQDLRRIHFDSDSLSPPMQPPDTSAASNLILPSPGRLERPDGSDRTESYSIGLGQSQSYYSGIDSPFGSNSNRTELNTRFRFRVQSRGVFPERVRTCSNAELVPKFYASLAAQIRTSNTSFRVYFVFLAADPARESASPRWR
ncbi:hypothetical protein GGX14DRAFT_406860 [Mycena pura]|uniref:Uncharacterized protein n=1 Tax=Mycena pura TaxID=153505 RepID=A0AAD6UPY2_9AGAR|nr:hypothetical protein GGX14DRAFT_406860 [Mycena pura]